MGSRRWMYTFVLGALQIGFAVGCNSGSGMDGNPPGPNPGGSTPVGATFSQNVQPIFNARCTGCHSPQQRSGSLDLSASVSYANLINKPASASCSASVAGAVLVRPGDTAGSMLWRKLANSNDKCGGAMPFGSAGLISVARSEFDTIAQWIQGGALNN